MTFTPVELVISNNLRKTLFLLLSCSLSNSFLYDSSSFKIRSFLTSAFKLDRLFKIVCSSLNPVNSCLITLLNFFPLIENVAINFVVPSLSLGTNLKVTL